MLRARVAAEIEAQRAVLRTRAARGLAAALGALALLTIIGMAILWPGNVSGRLGSPDVIAIGVQSATVTAVTGKTCPVDQPRGCRRDRRRARRLDRARPRRSADVGDDGLARGAAAGCRAAGGRARRSSPLTRRATLRACACSA
jgi:hypothetical protein